MKAPKRIITGFLLIAVSLACSSSQANSINQKSKATGKTGRQSLSAWKLGAPVNFQNMTVFPVISNEPASADEFITLDEGLRSGKVTIAELGAGGRARRLTQEQQVSDDAEVNKLAVINNSGKKLILIAGELLVGGKQDRIVSHDCIVASTNVPVPIEVFCVEHGRWQEETSFGQSRDVNVANGNSVGRGSGSGVGNGVGSSGVASVAEATVARLSPGVIGFDGVAAGKDSESKKVLIVSPNVRAKAQTEKSQTEVWAEVDKTVKENYVSTSTDTFTSVYKDEGVNRKIEDYEEALGEKLSGENIIGVVIAVGGTIISADVFANHSLFEKYWPKLLKSSTLEAINSTDTGSVDPASAQAFLSRVGGNASSKSKKGVYEITEHQSEADASFELLSATKGHSQLIHFNRMKKQ